MTTDDPAPDTCWHEALAFAVTGRRLPELGPQSAPDVRALAATLRSLANGGLLVMGPRPPRDSAELAALRTGLAPAQFAAAETALRRLLGLDRPGGTAVAGDRPLDRRERELVEDAPPHHGG